MAWMELVWSKIAPIGVPDNAKCITSLNIDAVYSGVKFWTFRRIYCIVILIVKNYERFKFCDI
jgi:hypothetical protein